MHRERLRSQKGCLVCRQRRKKCDEQKPKCVQCTRLRLVCKWDDDGTHHLGDNLNIERIVSVHSDRAVHSHMNTVSGRLRVADHDEINRDNMELPTGIVDVMSQRYTTTQTTKTEDYHLLITGIFKGWDQISKEIRSSDPWFKIILFDHQLQRSGQGLVARLAMSFNSIAMYQVSALKLWQSNAKYLLTVSVSIRFTVRTSQSQFTSVVSSKVWLYQLSVRC